jgi:hypothetical protein
MSHTGSSVPGQKVQLLLDRMDMTTNTIGPDGVLSIVNSLGHGGMTVCFATDKTPLSGSQCYVYVVTFPDAVTWTVRIPVQIQSLEREAITSIVEIEPSVLKRLEHGKFAWSPRLVAYCSGFQNPIAHPYIIST